MPQTFVVIIAGGRGERFWPESRATRPKHLLPIVGTTPMLRQTLDRVRPLVPPSRTFVITSASQEKGVRAVCAQAKLPAANVVAEPVGRDTAPAVGLAAALVGERDPQGLFAVLPADHVIHDGKAYRRDLEAAFAAAAETPAIITIGIEPYEPATGFGYIRKGGAAGTFEGHGAFKVAEFCEKPDLSTAKKYVSSGRYFWNAGMFVWSVPVANENLERHAPEIHAALGPVRQALARGRGVPAALKRAYAELPKISIDYAVLEKASDVLVFPARFDWDDVGAWPAVARHHKRDASGNVLRGQAMAEQASNNILFSDNDHLVAVVGADDLIVVHTADATLVCSREKAQEIKALLKRLGADPKAARWL